jgi:hypothetical protein
MFLSFLRNIGTPSLGCLLVWKGINCQFLQNILLIFGMQNICSLYFLQELINVLSSRILHFYVRIGMQVKSFRLCGNDFGITAVDDITNGITWAVFCFHIAHISFASSRYLFCLSVIVLARLCVFGTAMSIRNVFFVFLLMNVISGRLKGIVLSVSTLRFQYSLKLSFSHTSAGVYLQYGLFSSISSVASASF